ncbi:crustacean calcium-binding protein 23-like [Babylonia areolata]|uniref:crustacean calcium-binding protein 23-like n=1 Tax=Babylonia areolata TaxID=304850 RepID=UPI003FD5AA6F
MDCDRLAKETKEECARQLAKETDPVKRFRLRALMRGLDKIRAIGKSFKIMDDDGNRGLSMEEFVHGCEDWGITMPRAEIEQVFHTFNKDQNPGEAVLLNFNEFLDAVRPPMTKPRLDLVNKVFDHLNRTSPNYEQRKALEKEGKVGAWKRSAG